MMKFTVKNSNTFLPEGKHIVSVHSISPDQPKESADWKDRTPQLKVTFKEPKSGFQFSNWYNTKGYTKFEDLTTKQQQSGKYEARGDQGYAVEIKTGMRVVSEENTEKAINIIANLGYACGFDADKQISVEDLHGKTCGITIGPNDRMNNRVKGTFRPTVEQLEEVNA